MVDTTSFYSNWTPRVLSILRAVVGFLFIWHGGQKLFGYPPAPEGMMPDPLPMIIVVAGVMEFFGGLLILVGLFTRPVAFLLSGLMAAAYFMGHASGGFLPLQNGGEPAVVYCFVFLYLWFAGGGEWSLDRLVFSQNRER
ncbi:MAG: DoxX family protein [Pyrinomonadaceae bacterium]